MEHWTLTVQWNVLYETIYHRTSHRLDHCCRLSGSCFPSLDPASQTWRGPTCRAGNPGDTLELAWKETGHCSAGKWPSWQSGRSCKENQIIVRRTNIPFHGIIIKRRRRHSAKIFFANPISRFRQLNFISAAAFIFMRLRGFCQKLNFASSSSQIKFYDRSGAMKRNLCLGECVSGYVRIIYSNQLHE